MNTWESRLRIYEDTMGRDDRLFKKITEQENRKIVVAKKLAEPNPFHFGFADLVFLGVVFTIRD